MRSRLVRCSCLAAVVLLIPLVALGQSAPSDSVPRTAWGAQDLSGVWDYNSLTPLERPSEYEGREFLTEEEAARIIQRAVESEGADRRQADPKERFSPIGWPGQSACQQTEQYSFAWLERSSPGPSRALPARGSFRHVLEGRTRGRTGCVIPATPA